MVPSMNIPYSSVTKLRELNVTTAVARMKITRNGVAYILISFFPSLPRDIKYTTNASTPTLKDNSINAQANPKISKLLCKA